MKHSKLPWKEGKYGGIYPSGDNPPAITLMSHKDGSYRHNAKANTSFIITACNEHDTLKTKENLLNEMGTCLSNLLREIQDGGSVNKSLIKQLYLSLKGVSFA